MRSRSSVLSHILGSNPQICGYSELQMRYFDMSSLDLMEEKIQLNGLCKRNIGFYFDKILHNNLGISNDVISNQDCHFIIMMRNPSETISSIYRMGAITDVEWYTDMEKVLEYYCERLLEMENYSHKLKGRYFFIESNDLINKTQTVLDGLTFWLQLKKKLKKKYKIFNHTGKPGYGDPSENIKKGILQKTSYNEMVEISPEISTKAQISYDRCKSIMIENSFNN